MVPKGITFANRFDNVTGSAIREIFKVLARPNMISFAGGNPAMEALPDIQMAEIAKEVLLKDGKRILQYGATEGYPPFMESLLSYLNEQFSFGVGKENVLPITGSTSGMDLLCKALLNPGDKVLVESPTFLGNMQTFNLYQAELIGINSDDDGVILEDLEQAIIKHNPKMIYIIPTFQNPSGKTLALNRRKPIAEMAAKYGVLVVEDDPYRDLRYSGKVLPPIKSFDTTGHVAYMGSFSKIISPGIRVGYLVAQEDILRKCTIGKQGTDLHTTNLTQAMVDVFLRSGQLKKHIEEILPSYQSKMELMLEKLSDFPAGTTYTIPEGGLFIFVSLPEKINATELFNTAVEKGVAYVPGTFFYPEGGHHNTLRLNFSNSTLPQIEKGMNILSTLLNK